MSKFKSLEKHASDMVKETQGIWRELATAPGVKMKIARFGNPDFEKALNEAQRPYKQTLRAGIELPDEKWTEITCSALAKGVIKDWSGIKDEDDNEIPYNSNDAYDLLMDNQFRNIREEITTLSREQQAYLKNSVDYIVGN